MMHDDFTDLHEWTPMPPPPSFTVGYRFDNLGRIVEEGWKKFGYYTGEPYTPSVMPSVLPSLYATDNRWRPFDLDRGEFMTVEQLYARIENAGASRQDAQDECPKGS